MNKRFLEHLLAKEFVGELQLRSAVAKSRQTRTDLIDVLLKYRMLNEPELARALATFFRHSIVDLNEETPQESALDVVDGEYARRFQVLPLSRDKHRDFIRVAVSDPASALDALERIRRNSGIEPRPFVAERTALRQAVNYYYFGELPNTKGDAASRSVSGLLQLPSDDVLSGESSYSGLYTGMNEPSRSRKKSRRRNSGVSASQSGIDLNSPSTNRRGETSRKFGRSSVSQEVKQGGGTRVAELELRVKRLEDAIKHERRLLQSLVDVLVSGGITTKEDLLKRLRDR